MEEGGQTALVASTDSAAAEVAANMLVELTEATLEEAAALEEAVAAQAVAAAEGAQAAQATSPTLPAATVAAAADARVGLSFDSFEEVEAFMHAYEEAHFVKYYKSDSRTVAGARKRMPRRRMEDRLRYHSITFCCIHHGTFKSKSQGLRPRQTTLRSGCPAKMRFKISEDGKQLNMVEIVMEHTHPLNKDSFLALPQKRRLSLKEKEEAYDILEKRGKKSAQRHLQELGKEVKMRDLHNLLAASRRQTAIHTNIRAILDHLSETEDQSSVVEVVAKADSKIVGIFYQDREMARVYAAYPQHLVLDATCKSNHLRLPLYAVLVEDGNGDCEVVALFLVLASTLDSLVSMLRRFKANNPAWTQCRVILADKDFPERGVLEEEFPQASAQVCLYHALRAFRQEVSSDRMGLGKKEIGHCLRLMKQLATSKTEAEYFANYRQLLNSQLKKVVEYFNSSWHFLLEEWVEGFKARSIALKAEASKQLEPVDAVLQEALRDSPPAAALMANLKKAASALRNISDQSAARVIARERAGGSPTTTDSSSSPLHLFESFVTPFALKHVQRQLKLSWQVNINSGGSANQPTLSVKTAKGVLQVDPFSCTCVFFKSLGLPCRHVFAVRRYRGLPLFEKDTVSRRWTLSYYKSMSRVVAQEEATTAGDGERSGHNLFSRHERHIKASAMTKQLADAVAEAPAGRFSGHMAALQDLLSIVRNGAAAEVREAETSTDGGPGGPREDPIRIKVTSVTLPPSAGQAKSHSRKRQARTAPPNTAETSESVNGQVPHQEVSDTGDEDGRDSSGEEMDLSASRDASEEALQAEDDIPEDDKMLKEETS